MNPMKMLLLPMSAWVKTGLVLLLMATGLEVRAEPATCEVIAITDSAAMTVLCRNEAEKNIRLAGIDGPASQSLFRARAERSLSALLLQKQVVVDVVDTDASGEAIAQVYLGSTHVNASLVSNGMARCQGRGSKADWCQREESSARSGLRGLWSDPFLTTTAVQRPTAPMAAKRGQST